MGKTIDIVGHRFGKLTCLSFDSLKDHKTYWLFKCDCGIEKILPSYHVRCGETKSCGCLRFEKKTHGHGSRINKSLTHSTWRGMHVRAGKRKYYENVKICERWQKFENFLEDMGKRPSKDQTLDRIDSKLGYFKENCRWVSRRINNLNAKRTKQAKGQYRGVHWDLARSKWIAQCAGKSKRFNSAIKAAFYRDQLALREYGEHANLNFVTDFD